MLDTNVNTGEQDDPKTQLKRLVSLREELLAGYQKLQQEVQDLGRRRSQVRQLQHDLDSVRKDYEETTSRLDMLRINTRNTPGRINIAMWGTKPTGPSTDKRSAMALGVALFEGKQAAAEEEGEEGALTLTTTASGFCLFCRPWCGA